MNQIPPAWTIPHVTPVLGQDEVHVWKIHMNSHNESVRKFTAILSGQEKQYARRFHFADDCRKYTVSHAILRLILSGYLKEEPGCLMFKQNRYGKPYLDLPSSDIHICFNLSHSCELSLIAISRGSDIGIDIEHISEKVNILEISKRFFSEKEHDKIIALPEHLRREAFFRCWTRKEAYMKGKGKGISWGLNRFEVSVLPSEHPALIKSPDSPEDVQTWELFDINPMEGYAAALAIQCKNCHLALYQWQ